MKTQMLVLTASASAILAFAQTPKPPTVSPTPPALGTTTVSPFERTNQFRLGNLGATTITNSSGQMFSPEEIESQLVELRDAIEQAMPALNAITEVYSNSAAGSGGVVGGIAGVLGGILDRNTNNATGPSSNNTFGRILREAIVAANTNSTSTNFTQLRDFVALQTHLQATTPLFDRLGVSSNTMPSNIGGTENSSPTNTGAGRGPIRPNNYDNNNQQK